MLDKIKNPFSKIFGTVYRFFGEFDTVFGKVKNSLTITFLLLVTETIE